jgi:hypothetical protein
MGQLRLQLGSSNIVSSTGAIASPSSEAVGDHVPRYVPFGTTDKPSDGRIIFFPGANNTEAGTHVQRLKVSGKCTFGVNANDVKLVDFKGYFGDNEYGLGLDNAIGVPINNGTGCTRITSESFANVRFALGQDAKDLGGNAFYALDFDMELKGTGASFDLEVYRGTHLFATYTLVAGSGTNSTYVHYCGAGSDSNPDANSRDNCHWEVRVPAGEEFLGDNYILRAKVQDGSLEGGGDYAFDGNGAPYSRNTVVYLTDAVFGEIGCGESTATLVGGPDKAECTGTAVQTTASCPRIGYVLRHVTSVAGQPLGCEFKLDKGVAGQFVGFMDVVFANEPREEIAGVDHLNSDSQVATNAPLTVVVFPHGTTPVPFTPQRCHGTVTGTAGSGGTGATLTIEEVNDSLPWTGVGPSTFVVTDQILSTSDILDWACILEHDENYVGPNSEGDEEMQVRERILIWGDPAAIRF